MGRYIGYEQEYDLGGIYNLKDAYTGIVRSGLQFYLDAANKASVSGNTYNDISGLNENMTPVTLDTSTDYKGIINFGGTSANRLYRSTTTFNRSAGQELTVCAMVYPKALGGSYRDIIVNRSDSLYNWMLYQHATDGSIQLHGSAQNKSTYVPVLNKWVYIVATVDSSGNYKLYANGVVVQSLTGYSYQSMTPSYLVIGALGTGGEPWYGKGAVYQIYNRALSQAEINNNFNAIRTRFGL